MFQRFSVSFGRSIVAKYCCSVVSSKDGVTPANQRGKTHLICPL